MARRLADATEIDRATAIDRNFLAAVDALSVPRTFRPAEARLVPESRLDGALALELFGAEVDSRHVDLAARALKAKGQGFYTIGSSGHEGNVAVAAALRPDDPALLHYRSGAFFIERSRQYARLGHEPFDPVYAMLLGCVAAREEPIAGGRHKVFGSRELWIPPQTSTIASHLPKAVGMAFYIERARRFGLPLPVASDAIAVASFGDASVNHSTAAGAFNAASWSAHQGVPMPVLFVCEDNGLGISLPTPKSWIRAAFADRPNLRYFRADGLDLAAAYEAACQAVGYVRTERRPAFLHLGVVRLLGHAGSDAELAYRPLAEVEADEARDPLISAARLLVERGVAAPAVLRGRYEAGRARVAELAARAASRPRLTSAAEVVAPLAPLDTDAIAAEVRWQPRAEPVASERRAFWADGLPEDDPRPKPLAQQLNRALGDLLVRYPEVFVLGQDVGKKGGVYGVTRRLHQRARRGRVFDTLLDEQTILGTGCGAAQLGALPVPEIQYLAYLHNAEDQLRGEAASLQFFSQGQYRNGMVVRIAAYAYQKGFGGHFHNDHALGVLRDIPGLVVASPALGDDAVAMLQTCVAAARTCGTVCVFLEPIALYGTRDLHAAGDAGLCTRYDPCPAHVPIGRARVHGDGQDLCIVSWANGLYLSLRAARRLEQEHGIRARVVDLRWIVPLPIADVVREARTSGRVLVVDETRRSGSPSEALLAALLEEGFATQPTRRRTRSRTTGVVRRLTAVDTFVPLGDAANLVLVQEADIVAAGVALAARG
ncbi:MAG: MFS transporter [Myxococcales bacterium]|nr:MFS transporter [Myxococcales bacterium]